VVFNSVKTTYYNDIEQIKRLSAEDKDGLKKVAEVFRFKCNDYYLNLINWDDPNDPIKNIVIPHIKELDEWGRMDPSDEKGYSPIAGLEHKYNSTALMLVSNKCEGLCRYCFRKRVFIENNELDYLHDIDAAIDYINCHEEITNILLTGGDPLMLETERLAEIIAKLSDIDHVQIIRIGTRTPVYNPARIVEDQKFLDLLSTYNTRQRRIYIMTHFVHPNEVTDLAECAAELIQTAGSPMCNQTPLIRGVNDDPDVLAELFKILSFTGVIPYYVFQCRPAVGNKVYTLPVETSYRIFESAKAKVSGLAKRARFVMSHSTGKIEIVGLTEQRVYMKYHRAAVDADSGKFFSFESNPDAYWLDDYEEVVREYPVGEPYRAYGPD